VGLSETFFAVLKDMTITEIQGTISQKESESLTDLFTEAFRASPSKAFNERLNEKPGLSVLLAWEDEKIVGFKIGYQRFRGIFFSWLGAVTRDYRRNGIARALLREQHRLCASRGYFEIQTEAAGKNAAMLILNLQEGFEVYGVHLGHQYKLTVQLRRQLSAPSI
jgi:predicted GNAT superfamily acetyltransferase